MIIEGEVLGKKITNLSVKEEQELTAIAIKKSIAKRIKDGGYRYGLLDHLHEHPLLLVLSILLVSCFLSLFLMAIGK